MSPKKEIEFAGINLKSYPSLFLKLNSGLLSCGINKLSSGERLDENTVEDSLTLYFKPNYCNGYDANIDSDYWDGLDSVFKTGHYHIRKCYALDGAKVTIEYIDYFFRGQRYCDGLEVAIITGIK